MKISQSFTLAIFSIVNIVISFVIQIITFNIIGPGKETDALFLGLSIPTFILSITVVSLNNVLLPVFSNKDRLEKNRLATSLIIVFGGGAAFISALLYYTVTSWLPYLANGFDSYTYSLSVELVKIQILSIPFYITFSIFWSILNAERRHVLSEAPAAISNIVSLPILFFCLSNYGIKSVAYIYTIKIIVQNVLIIITSKGFSLYFSFKDEKENIIEVLSKLRPVVLGAIYYKSEQVIDRSLLTNSASGTLSLFFLAQQMMSAVNQIINKSIVIPAISKISINKNNKDKIYETYIDGYKKIAIFIGGVSAIFIIFGKEILEMLISLRSATSGIDSVSVLYLILFCLAGSLIGNACGALACSSFYAVGDTKTPAYISVITYTIYIPFKVYIYFCFGVWGLAIITSIYSVLNFIILNFVYLKKHIQNK